MDIVSGLGCHVVWKWHEIQSSFNSRPLPNPYPRPFPVAPRFHLRYTAARVAGQRPPEAVEVPTLESRRRVEQLFRDLCCNDDRQAYRFAQEVLEGQMQWLEKGIVE